MNHKNQLVFIPALILFLLCSFEKVSAEGTKELSPTPSDSAMLHTNASGFGNFAAFDSVGTLASLNIRIKDFMNETLYIGLSGEANDDGVINSTYMFRIVDTMGNVVFGPFTIGPANDNAETWALAVNGPDILGMGGYSTNTTMYPYSVFTPTYNGDYTLEFDDGSTIANILWYDFTVVTDAGVPQPGRLWSRNWAIRTPPVLPNTLPECDFDRDFNGAFYSYTMDGFVSRIDFNGSGFQGLSFNVAFGDTGPGTTGNVLIDRRSINNMDATRQAADHMVFVNNPDTMLFPSSEDQCGTVALLSVSCEEADSFCINVGITQRGQIEVILDFNDNGEFDENTTDVILAVILPEADSVCIPWNGLKGDGTPLQFGEEVPTVIRYSQGVQHYASFDVELLKNGYCVETIRPICPGIATDRLFWDDSQITDDVNTVTIDEGDPGTGQPKVNLNGCPCGVAGCRTWTTFQVGDPPAPDCSGTPIGYGEMATLNTWWFANTVVLENINLPFAQVQIIGDSAICQGETTEFFAEIFPDTVAFDYFWEGPGGFTTTNTSTGPISLGGTYYLTITDPVSGCMASDSAILFVNQNPTTTIDFDCVAPNEPNANIDLMVSGGLPPYTYMWSNGPTTQDQMNVPPGTYFVTVTDANGCMTLDTVTVQGCCELQVVCPPADGGQFQCVEDVPTMSTGVINVVGYCDTFSITPIQVDNGGAGCPGDPLIITRTFTVEDEAGNTATCTQTYTVIDNLAPTVVAGVNDTSVICGDPVTTDDLGIPTYVDNCSSAIVTFEDDSTGFDGICSNGVIGVITRTFFAEDSCGNINNSVIQIISVIDTIPPTFTAPDDLTLDCAADLDPSSTGEVLDSLDNCSSLSISFSDLVTPGECPASDTVFRTWVLTDACGNSSTDVQILVLLDTVPPTFTVPDTISLDCGADLDPEFTGEIDDANDNCSTFEITFSDIIVQDGCPVNDTVFRTWVVEDACGNSSSGVQVILRLDTDPPVFTTPADTILDCGMSTDTSITGSITDATDNCSEVTIDFTDEVIPGTCPGIDTTFRTWIVTDNCFNTATGVQVIIRADTLPPVIDICPADMTLACDDSIDPEATGIPTATDACDPEVEFDFIDIPPAAGCSNNSPIIRVWTATDNCGNSSTCSQELLIIDTIPPSFIIPDDVTIECNGDTSVATNGSPVEVIDDCSEVTLTYSDLVVAGDCNPYSDTILRTWVVTDVCGNSASGTQNIFLIDSVAPTFTVPPLITISCDQDSLPSTTGNVTDTLDNCSFITVDFIDAILPNGCPVQDTIERTWIVSDACGNSSTAIQLILRLDLEAPLFTVPLDTVIDCGTDTTTATLGDVTDATDNCSGVTISYDDVTIDGTCPVLYVINRTWTVVDECLNETSGLQVITVQDTMSPTFIAPDDITVDCDVDLDDLTLLGDVSEVEDCGVIADTSYSDAVTMPGCDGTAVLLRTFVISDECGNSATGTQSITIQDTLSPEILIPADITIECDQDPQDTTITGGMIVFFDNCSMEFMASFTDDVSGLTGCNGTGTILRLWLVGDECDNSATMTQVITIEDSTPPEAICQDFMIDFGDQTTITLTPEDIDNGSFDNCGDVTLSISQTEFTCDMFIGQTSIPVILTVTDECGNSSTCEAQVSGIGGALEIDCPDDITISLGPGECTAIVNYVVTAEAICGGSAVTITQIDNSGLTSGDAFPIGTTIQTYQATNGVDTATCSFTITVIEADIPVVLACNDTINVSVDANCEAHIFADMILEGDQYGCYDDFIITIENYGTDTGWIVITGLPLNECYTVTITDPDSGNSCWGTICLEDKIPPQIICACPVGGGGDSCVVSCVEVDLLVAGNIPSNLLPEVIENCGDFEVEIADISVSDDGCGEGFIIVTWIVTDANGASASCVQEFQIEPLSLDDLVFPPNYEGECGTSSHPDVTGWPTVDGFPLSDQGGLCNIFTGYWDKVLQDCGGGTKIVRTWTILDWCTLELVEQAQIIKLSDDEGPVLNCPADFTVGTDFWYCYANVSLPKPIAQDECSDVVSFVPTVSAGILVQFGNNFVLNELPIGDHVIIWTVSDLCGNSSTCSFTITVEDDVAPVANCDHHTVVSLTNDGPKGITLVPAEVFDDGSYDNCGPVTFRARRMTSCIDVDWTTLGACVDHVENGVINGNDLGTVHRPCVPFACCDLTTSGSLAVPIMVELEVTDASGNVNYCMVEVTVQDKIPPFLACPPDITVSCDFWFEVQEGTFVDGAGNNNGSLDEDPLSRVFGNMLDGSFYDESDREPIIIHDPGNHTVSQPHNWGLDGWAEDNCRANLQVRVRVIDDCSGHELPGNAPPGAVKLIERRFTAGDGQSEGSGNCTQRIWVVDFDPFFITDNTCFNANPNDGVIWPCDVLLTTCPEDLGNTGEPQIIADACNIIGVAYEDTRFDFVDGACFKILRRWSVIDWCQYDPLTGEGLWHYTQVIKVHDEDGPEFTECPAGPVVLCVADEGVSLPDNNQAFLGEDNPLASSCSAHLNLCQVVHETCSDFVTFDVKIYPFNGNEFIQMPVTTAPVDSNNNAVLCFDTRQSTIQSIRLNGIPYNSPWCGDYHRILWSVQDGCGNWSHCEYLFRLEDCKQPSPVCVNGLSTVVMPIGCQITLWAKDFDASSFDDCTAADELLFSFSGDTYQPSKVFDATNIPAFGVETSINIWVADGGTDDNCNGVISWDERNKDFCTTTIVFTDNSGHCGGSGPIIYEGVLMTQDHEPIESARVSLETDEEVVYSTVTSDDGKYALAFTPIDGQRYRIVPERDDEHKNGVSTLDLVEIQKHLLGKDLFTSPYEYIAADATNNQTVSAIDLIELRKLILGIYTRLPNNKSWRFVDPASSIADPTNPWPFQEVINMQYDGTTASGLDFIGVKVGDINGTAQANATQILPRNGKRTLNILAEAEAVKQTGEVVSIVFTIPELVSGFQWTLETNGLKYQGISSNDITIGDEHIGLLDDGVITMSWNQIDWTKAIDKKEIQIVMHFIATQEGNPLDMISLTSKVTQAEAYSSESEILDVKLSQRSTEAAKDFALYQNEPNPWNGETVIRFDLPEAGNVQLTLFDASGMQIKMIEKFFEAGLHAIALSNREISATGVIYYRLDSGSYSATKKMIRIE